MFITAVIVGFLMGWSIMYAMSILTCSAGQAEQDKPACPAGLSSEPHIIYQIESIKQLLAAVSKVRSSKDYIDMKRLWLSRICGFIVFLGPHLTHFDIPETWDIVYGEDANSLFKKTKLMVSHLKTTFKHIIADIDSDSDSADADSDSVDANSDSVDARL